MTDVIGSLESDWRPLLAPGESLLWTGAPEGGLKWRPSDWFPTAFGLLWTALVVFGPDKKAWASASPWFLLAWRAPLIVMGIYLLIGRFFVDSWRRGRTRYALTDRRALIATEAFGRRLRSIPIAPQDQIELRPGAPGSVMFPQEPGRWVGGRYRQGAQYGFEFIPDAEKVYRLLLEIQSKAAARS